MTGLPERGLVCREVVELVSDYLEGALGERDRVLFEQHLAGCDGCTAYLDQMRQTVRLTGTLTPEALDPVFRARLLEAFRGWSGSGRASAELPATFAATRDALHRLAVYVISPAQRLANGEIILRATPGGFSTFEFDGRTVGVDGADLVVDGVHHPIGSLNDAARLVGIAPDVAQQNQFDVPPHGDLDEPLAVDAHAACALGAWYAFATDVLDAVRSGAGPDEDATIVRIWPEHFDAAVDLGDEAAGRRGTYGASPGDRRNPEPYLYASPWAGRIDAFFDAPSFKGAVRTRRRLAATGDPRGAAIEFLLEARDHVRRGAG
jgi:hypothetical protein